MDEKLEKLAQKIFNEYKGTEEEISMEEALEMARMESGAKELKNYTQAEVEKKKKVERPKKVDEDKNAITEMIADILKEKCYDVVIENMGKLISFEYKSKPYTVDIKFARNKYKERGGK